ILHLPVRPPCAADDELPAFEPPVAAPGMRHETLRELPLRRTIELDLATHQTVHTLHSGEFGAALARLEPIDMDLGHTFHKRFRISEYDPLAAHAEVVQRTTMRRADWSVRIECRTRLSSTRSAFQFSGELEAFEDDEAFARRAWRISIPRDLT
ncbi:MAG: CocE/NonD family hydrolase, partial [Geminicoccaceae bacterium]